MRGLVAILRREVVERRTLFYAAAAASLVPLAAPLARGMTGAAAADMRAWTALVLSSAFAFGLATGLGVSSLAGPIATRRIGFEFARPVSAFAIWAGSLLGMLMLALGSAVIVWIPSLVTGATPPWSDLGAAIDVPRLWPFLLPALLVLVFSLGHWLTIAFRSRSLWLLIDVALVVIASLIFLAAARRLTEFAAMVPLVDAMLATAIVWAIAVVVAGFASVAHGRTEIRSAHRASSAALWAIVGLGLVGVHAYAAWVLGAGPRDLTTIWAEPAARGPWMILEGEARGTHTVFLVDSATGESHRARVREYSGPTISGDGRHAAWVAGGYGEGPFEVMSLTFGEESPRRTRIALDGHPSLFVLSPDGSRAATFLEGVLAIHDLVAGRTVAAARPNGGYLRGLFVNNEVFRTYRETAGAPDERSTRIEVLEFDAVRRTLVLRGRRDFPTGQVYLVASPGGARLCAIHVATRELWLLDGRTADLIAQLAGSLPDSGRWAGFLADGRVVVSEKTGPSLRLRLFTRDGVPAGEIPLPAGIRARMGEEVEPGRLVVAVESEGNRFASYVVGLDERSVRKIAEGLSPVAWLSRFSWDVDPKSEPGSEGTKLFYGPDRRSLVRLDPATGARRLIVGRAATEPRAASHRASSAAGAAEGRDMRRQLPPHTAAPTQIRP